MRTPRSMKPIAEPAKAVNKAAISASAVEPSEIGTMQQSLTPVKRKSSLTGAMSYLKQRSSP
jgi:hypothetical protein